MERLSISIDDELASAFDAYLGRRGYANRSEAMRDLIRQTLEQERLQNDDRQMCIASLSYVYNHHERELAARLTDAHHQHHDLAYATTHVHLDHDNCFEVAILRGPSNQVRRFADQVVAERGVRHGELHLVPVSVEHESHAHGHLHSHPTT
jgi:CopG family nickel-responsive transcriptional regulator